MVGVHPAVDLHAEVDPVAHRLPHRRDALQDGLDQVGVAHPGVPAREGGEAHRGEAVRHRPPGVRGEGLRRLAADVQVEAHLVPALAPQEGVRRGPVALAGDVPQGDVQRGEGGADHRPPEVGVAVEELPVVLDAQRVLPQEVGSPGLQDAPDGLRVAVDAPLAEAGDPLLGVHQEIEPAPDLQPLQRLDLHPAPPAGRLQLAGGESLHPWLSGGKGQTGQGEHEAGAASGGVSTVIVPPWACTTCRLT